MERAIPYRGDAPYIFISYAHKDAASVLPIVATMQASGFRIWFDEGIDPGTEWDNVIAAQIEKCRYFLAFVSKNYLASENCKDELNFARDLGKHRLLVYLEDVALPSGMAMRMNRIQSVFKYKYADEKSFYNVLFSADGIYEMCDGEPRSAADEGSRQSPFGAAFAQEDEADAISNDGKIPFVHSRRPAEPFEMIRAFQMGFSHIKSFFTRPTQAQMLRRMLAVCVYAVFFFGGLGYSAASGVLGAACLPFAVIAIVAAFKKKKQAPKLCAARKRARAKRNRGFIIASYIFPALALSVVLTTPVAAPVFFLWSVYCFFASFVPKGHRKLGIGLLSIGRLTLRVLLILISLIFIGSSV